RDETVLDDLVGHALGADFIREFDAAQEAANTRGGDEFMRLERLQFAGEQLFECRRAGDQAFTFDNFEVFQCKGGRYRMARVRRTVRVDWRGCALLEGG